MISPIKELNITKKIKIINSVLIFISRQYENNKPKIKDVNAPPKRPSQVLFGLILINLFFPNFIPKMYENISKEITTKINKLKCKKILLLKSIFKKKIKDIRI